MIRRLLDRLPSSTRSNFQKKLNQSIVFNNQNTTLLSTRVEVPPLPEQADNESDSSAIVFMHDNRIFAFREDVPLRRNPLSVNFETPVITGSKQSPPESNKTEVKSNEESRAALGPAAPLRGTQSAPSGSASDASYYQATVTAGSEKECAIAMESPVSDVTVQLNEEGGVESGDVEKVCRELILHLLTTPKYRGLSAMYLLFHLLDETFLIAIIVLSIINGTFTTPDTENMALLSAIGLEVFYDVMVVTNKYWILQRLNLYIGLLFYLVYCVLIQKKISDGDITGNDITFVWSVIGGRAACFLCEESVDVSIDDMLHNDLLKISDSNWTDLKIPQSMSTSYFQSLAGYLDVRNSLQSFPLLPSEATYVGSIFAWSARSIHNNKWRKEPISNLEIWVFPLNLTVPFYIPGLSVIAALIGLTLCLLLVIFAVSACVVLFVFGIFTFILTSIFSALLYLLTCCWCLGRLNNSELSEWPSECWKEVKDTDMLGFIKEISKEF